MSAQELVEESENTYSTLATPVVEGDGVGLGVDTGDDRHGGEEEGCKETSREHDDDGECE